MQYIHVFVDIEDSFVFTTRHVFAGGGALAVCIIAIVIVALLVLARRRHIQSASDLGPNRYATEAILRDENAMLTWSTTSETKPGSMVMCKFQTNMKHLRQTNKIDFTKTCITQL